MISAPGGNRRFQAFIFVTNLVAVDPARHRIHYLDLAGSGNLGSVPDPEISDPAGSVPDPKISPDIRPDPDPDPVHHY